MKLLIALLIVLLIILQYKLWFSAGGLVDTFHLKNEIVKQQQKNADLKQQNAILAADIKALKQDKNAIASKARSDLGMVKQGETFYQVVS